MILQDFLQEQRIPGFPAFSCRAADGEGVHWWAPMRSGESAIDYPAGAITSGQLLAWCRLFASQISIVT